MGVSNPQQNFKRRLSLIKGQVNGIETMIDSDRDCNEVIVQIQAVRASLASLGEKLIENEALCCVDATGVEAAEQVDRLRTLIKDLFKLS